jgi:hypothetical protein
MTCSRRSFIRTVALGIPAAGAFARDAAPAIRAVLLTASDTPRAIVRGAQFGAEEARRTAMLVGRDFALDVIYVADAAAASREAARARREGAVVIAGGVRPAIAESLAAGAAPLLAIVRREEAEAELPDAWRVSPIAARYAEVLHASRGHLQPGEAESVRVVAWHPALSRYGAGELNERFTSETGESMDEEAWFGWITTKLVVESALRKRDIGSTRLDGHKGVLLRFDGARRLHQPLYLVVRRGGKETALYV